MFNHIPEIENFVNKSIQNAEATLDFNANVLAKSLEYFNELTEKKFAPMTSQVAESINKVTDYAKENIKTTTGSVRSLFATSK